MPSRTTASRTVAIMLMAGALSGVALAADTTAADVTTSTPAHLIAQRFAAGSEANPISDERPVTEYELEMLERARLEAAIRRNADEEAAAAHKAAAKAAEGSEKRPDVEKSRVDKAARPAQRSQTPIRSPADAPPNAEPQSPATGSAQPEAPRIEIKAKPLERRMLPANIETRTTVRPLERRSQPPAPRSPAKVEAAKAVPETATARQIPGKTAPVSRDQRFRRSEPVSLLVVFSPAAFDQNLIDPVACFADMCFVSTGLTDAAKAVPRDQVMALKTTRDLTPDSCRQKTACVFRGVSLREGDRLEIIDVASDRKAVLGTRITVHANTGCRASRNKLTCTNIFATPDFDAWVVPENIARATEPHVIEDLVADSLPRVQHALNALSNDK